MHLNKNMGRLHGAGRIAGLLWLALPAAVLAAEGTDPAVAKAPFEPLGAGSLLQFTVSLLLVLAAIVVSAWLLRRFGRLQSSANGALRIIGGLSVGARERVVLVQVGKDQLLLGVAPGQVRTLHVLDQPLVIEQGSGAKKAGDHFAERLAAALRGGKPS